MSNYYRIKTRIYEIVEEAWQGDLYSKIFEVMILIIIFVNIIAVILETVPSIFQPYKDIFNFIDKISIIIFIIEYFVRVWISNVNIRYKGRIKGRLRYIKSPMAIIDLIAIIPFFFPFILIDFRELRMIRLFRLLRVFKLARYFLALRIFGRVLLEKKEEFVLSFILVFMLLIISSSMMYFFEHEVQPEVFTSIPQAMWWGVATLSTVGYGDVYPVTSLGKIFGATIAMLGIGIFAIPTGIFATGLMDAIHKKNSTGNICPYCGNEIELDSLEQIRE